MVKVDYETIVMKTSEPAPEPVKKPRGRPRAFDRDAALDQAMRLFWDRGYEGTALDDLTAAMGISPSSLYAVFGDKERLFGAALERYAHGPGAFTRRIFAEEPTARGAFTRLLRTAAAELTRPERPAGCMVALSATHGSPAAQPIRALLQRYRQAAQEAMTARLRQGIAAGDLPAGTDAQALAVYYFAILQGMSMQARDGARRAVLLGMAATAMKAWPGG